MNVRSDPYTFFKQLWLFIKNSGGSSGIQTHDVCDAGAMLYQLLS